MNYKKILLAVVCSCVFGIVQAAELFLKTEKQGYYSVTVSDQTIISSSNTFRFFDLSPGSYTVTISDIYTGNQMFSANIILIGTLRKVLVINQNWNMQQIAEIPVSYANWYQESSQQISPAPVNPVVNTGASTTGNTGANNQSQNEEVLVVAPPSVLNVQEFESVKKQLKSESFEKNRVEFAKSVSKKNLMTSDQIAELCKVFSFDNYRLEYAKFAYDYCVDQNSYYKVSSTFTFSSYARELEKYIENK